MFHLDVACVLSGCCKSRSGCCTCCNGYTHMLQASVSNASVVSDGWCTCFIWVLHIFHTYVAIISSACCIYFHTYVASVSYRCCICFAIATHMFPSCFRCMLQVFQLFRTYVANVSSKCCKSRFGVAYVVVDLIYSSRLLQLLGPPICAWVWTGREQ